MAIVGDILNRARVFLNDTEEDLYTNEVLFPFLSVANDKFRDELLVHGIATQKTVAAYFTVPISTSVLTPLPDDFIMPVQLWQRQSGTNYDFVKIVEGSWPSGYTGNDCNSIANWNYRNQIVNIAPANQINQVRLDYDRVLVEVDSADDQVEIRGSVNFLAAEVAMLASADIGQNPVESLKNGTRATDYLTRLLQINIKNQQGVGARRLPFRRNVGIRIR